MKFNGLTDREVEESRKKHGSNAIPDSEPTTFWQEFKDDFRGSDDQDPVSDRSFDDRYVFLWLCRNL